MQRAIPMLICALLVVISSCSPDLNPSPAASSRPTPTLAPIQQTQSTPDNENPGQILDTRGVVSENCVSPLESAPDNITGKLAILEGADLNLADVRSGKKEFLGKTRSAKISPDHLRIAYVGASTDSAEKQLFVKDYAGNTVTSFVLPQGSGQVLDWLDNRSLLVSMQRNSGGGGYVLDSTMVIDVENQATREMTPEYPGVFDVAIGGGLSSWNDYANARTVYSPDLRRVVYPALLDDEAPIMLWDLESRKEIGRMHGQSLMWGSTPRWTRDGSNVIVNAVPSFTSASGKEFINATDSGPYQGGTELFRIDQKGQITRLTYLTRSSPSSEANFVLSNDERHIAFWLWRKTSSPETLELAILDLRTDMVTGMCIYTDIGEDSFPPVWSPDDTALSVTVSQDKRTRAHLISLADQTDFSFPEEGQRVVGWLRP